MGQQHVLRSSLSWLGPMLRPWGQQHVLCPSLVDLVLEWQQHWLRHEVAAAMIAPCVQLLHTVF